MSEPKASVVLGKAALPKAPAGGAGRWFAGALAVAVIGVALRLPLLSRQGLWVDEVFSLALAAGHSLEQPASETLAELGDFSQAAQPEPAGSLARRLRPGSPPAPLWQVTRAVALSDTNPPLYYWILSLWTRAAGASDLSLRFLSLLGWSASFALLFAFAWVQAGPKAAFFAAAFHSTLPFGAYYATEGRMYALAWALSLALALLVQRVRARTAGPWAWLGLVLALLAGVLTHYFFLFPAMALLAWGLAGASRRERRSLLSAAALAALLAAPWYLRLPDLLQAWRVSSGWLDGQPPWSELLAAPARLAWQLAQGYGEWCELDSSPGVWSQGLAAAGALWMVLALWNGDRRLKGLAALGVAWTLASCAGLAVFDVLRHTRATEIPRLAGLALPGLALAAGAALAAASPRRAALALLPWLAAWALEAPRIYALDSRMGNPLKISAQMAEQFLGGRGPLIVQSIPSGVLGVARYLPPDQLVAAWVSPLGQRSEADIDRWTKGRAFIGHLRLHAFEHPSPQRAWLAARSARIETHYFRDAVLEVFELDQGRRTRPSQRSGRR